MTQNPLDLVINYGAILLAVAVGWFSIRNAARIFLQARRNRIASPPVWVQDVSDQELEIPKAVAEAIAQVEALGMERIGVQQVALRMIPYPMNNWIYATPDGAIYAEISPVPGLTPPALTGILSFFPNDAAIMTTYPVGENVQEADFHSRFSARSIQAAYDYHQRQTDAWRAIHGEPITVRTLADVERQDNIYRARHSRRNYQRLTRLYLQMGGLYLLMALASLLLIAALALEWPPLIPVIIFAAAFVIVGFGTRRIRDEVRRPPGSIEA
jgi:hypothetical protein